MFIDALADMPNAWLELRTKSTQVRALLNRKPEARCVCAFSLSPAAIADAFEHRAPNLESRLAAMARLQQAGWTIGLRFDPIIAISDAQNHYAEFFAQVFARLDATRVHSVTLGAMRLPPDQARRITALYPDEALFAVSTCERDGVLQYGLDSDALLSWCYARVAEHIDSQRIFLQTPNAAPALA
jgi:spore photoproduct lyase